MWSANELYGISSIYCFFFFFSCSSSSYSSSSSTTYYYYYYYYYKWGCHACEARVGQIHILVEYGQPLFVWLSRDWPSVRTYVHTYVRAGGGSYFPYILLNEIQTMFSKRSARVLPADLCTDHAHYVKNQRSTGLRKNKNMAVEGGTVSHYYILVFFSVKQFPFADFGICNI